MTKSKQDTKSNTKKEVKSKAVPATLNGAISVLLEIEKKCSEFAKSKPDDKSKKKEEIKTLGNNLLQAFAEQKEVYNHLSRTLNNIYQNNNVEVANPNRNDDIPLADGIKDYFPDEKNTRGINYYKNMWHYCELAFLLEQLGDPKVHALKLCIMYKNTEEAMQRFVKNNTTKIQLKEAEKEWIDDKANNTILAARNRTDDSIYTEQNNWDQPELNEKEQKEKQKIIEYHTKESIENKEKLTNSLFSYCNFEIPSAKCDINYWKNTALSHMNEKEFKKLLGMAQDLEALIAGNKPSVEMTPENNERVKLLDEKINSYDKILHQLQDEKKELLNKKKDPENKRKTINNEIGKLVKDSKNAKEGKEEYEKQINLKKAESEKYKEEEERISIEVNNKEKEIQNHINTNQANIMALRRERFQIANKYDQDLYDSHLQILQKREKELEGMERSGAEKLRNASDATKREFNINLALLSKEVSDLKCELFKLNCGKSIKDYKLHDLDACYEHHLKQTHDKIQAYFIEKGISKKAFETFINTQPQNDDKAIPPVEIDGNDIGYPGYYLIKLPVHEDERYAAIAASLGKFTNCCQSLGDAGAACCVHSIADPNGGNYVVFKGELANKSPEDTPFQQTWAWRSENGAIVFDSIETHDKTNEEEQKMGQAFYNKLAENLVNDKHTHRVTCGAFSGISAFLGTQIPGEIKEVPQRYHGYRDSHAQKDIFNANKPYYAINYIPSAKTELTILLNQIFEHTENLSSNKDLCAIINSALLGEKNQELLDLITKIANETNYNGQSRANETSELIQKIQNFMQGNVSTQDIIKNPEDNFLAYLFTSKSTNPLFTAVEDNDLETAEQLLRKFARENFVNLLNKKDNNQMAPLHLAANKGNKDMCKLLIRYGADVNLKDDLENTPLIHAINEKHTDLAVTMINRCKHINLNIDNRSAEMPINIALKLKQYDVVNALIKNAINNPETGTNLAYAFESGVLEEEMHVSLREKIISAYLKSPRLNDAGENALHIAVDEGNLILARALIEKGMDPFALSNSGESALNVAIEEEKFDFAVELLNKANASDINPPFDGLGNSPLQSAIEVKQTTLADALIKKGARLQYKDSLGMNALMVACQHHPDYAIKLLDEHKKLFDVNEKSLTGSTPLMFAIISKNSIDFIQDLITRGADLNAVDSSNKTPLILAIESKQYELASLLLKAGADPHTPAQAFMNCLTLAIDDQKDDLSNALLENLDNIKQLNLPEDAEYKSPLLMASIRNNSQLVQKLIDLGCDVNALDNKGCTLLMNLCHNHPKLAISLLENKTIPEEMIHISDNANVSPLQKAAQLYNNQTLISKLIELGADVKTQNIAGRGLLHTCDVSNIATIVDYFRKNNMSVEIEDRYGFTPLMRAVERDDFFFAQELCKQGANPYHQNKDGKSAIDLAKTKSPRIFDYFKSLEVNELKTQVDQISEFNQNNPEHQKLFSQCMDFNLEAQMQKMINKGANIYSLNNNNVSFLDIANNTEKSNLVIKLKNMDSEAIDALIKSNPKYLDSKTLSTQLFQRCLQGDHHPQVLDKILKGKVLDKTFLDTIVLSILNGNVSDTILKPILENGYDSNSPINSGPSLFERAKTTSNTNIIDCINQTRAEEFTSRYQSIKKQVLDDKKNNLITKPREDVDAICHECLELYPTGLRYLVPFIEKGLDIHKKNDQGVSIYDRVRNHNYDNKEQKDNFLSGLNKLDNHCLTANVDNLKATMLNKPEYEQKVGMLVQRLIERNNQELINKLIEKGLDCNKKYGDITPIDVARQSNRGALFGVADPATPKPSDTRKSLITSSIGLRSSQDKENLDKPEQTRKIRRSQ